MPKLSYTADKKGDMPADATKNNLYKPQTPGADIEPPRIAE
jgi:hypothetical protein